MGKSSASKPWLGSAGGMAPTNGGAHSDGPAPPPPEPAVFVGQPPWLRRFFTQFTALFWKNLLVNWRNLRATVLRVLAPLFFMLLLFLTNLALTADNPKRPYAVSNKNPQVDAVAPIPPCETNMYIRTPCYDFFWTAENDTANVVRDKIVPFIMAANPGRPISSDQVLDFTSTEPNVTNVQNANAWLAANPERVVGGVHFTGTEGLGLGAFSFLLQVNQSVQYFKDKFQDPTFFFQVPLQVAVERALASHYYNESGQTAALAGQLGAGAWGPSWDVSSSMFAHPTTNSINIVGKVVGGFVFAANMFSFVLLSSVVYERERGLRQALKTMGMLESAFWMSWMAVEFLAAIVFTLILIGFGAMFQFKFFTLNSFGLIFLLFFLFQLSMTSVAFLISTLLRKSSTAVVIGFVIFLLGWIFQTVVVFGFPYAPDYYKKYAWATAIFSLMPWCPLAKAAEDLGAATEDETSVGISWSNRKDYCLNIPDPSNQALAFVAGTYQDFQCVFPIPTVMIVLALEWVLYFLLAIYLDHVLPDENGVRKGRIWYFLSPFYWCGTGWSRSKKNAVNTARGVRSLKPPLARAVALDQGVERDPDVEAEEDRMRELLEHRTGSGDALALQADSVNAVEVFGLQKVFGAKCCGGAGCCSPACLTCGLCMGSAARQRRRRRGSEFWAIKGSWFAIERGRLFCLLGPNGAGKTTTINCLTGVLPTSGGDALVYGESLTTPGGMDRIRSLMGVCPQFDVLWGELTGMEHLRLYGRIKGLPKNDVAEQASELLHSVKLSGARNMKTAAYSGGMRRRLSVAIALLGDPLIVYLDEPTTGMDPISRRHVWDIIESSKAGRAIVLTTHSMEEADILGDQIAIMARGRLRAIGSSLRLKQRFGSGYQLSVSVLPPTMARLVSTSPQAQEVAAEMAANAGAVKRLFEDELGVEPADESRAYITFLVPKDREQALPAFLRQLDSRREELGITDVQISLTSLEEVFLTIARKAELEAAAAEGQDTVRVELEEGGFLEVPLGEEWATPPSTGQHYRVQWTQDDNGALQVLRAVPVARLPSSNGRSHRGAVAPSGATTGPERSSGSSSSRSPPGTMPGLPEEEAAPGAVEMTRSLSSRKEQ